MTNLQLWRNWVDELTDHPLDAFEWDGMLECRDALDTEIELGLAVADEVDEIDADFQRLTRQVPGREGPWWHQRLPSDPDYIAYMEV